MDKAVEYYLRLPYTIELQRAAEGGWFVHVKELPGCMSQGDTPQEAIEMIADAMRGWIEISLEDGDPIPEPRHLDDYSGKFVVRVPRSLHRDLVEAAVEEGVNLNQYVNVVLAHPWARRVPRSKPRTTKGNAGTTTGGWREEVCTCLFLLSSQGDSPLPRGMPGSR